MTKTDRNRHDLLSWWMPHAESPCLVNSIQDRALTVKEKMGNCVGQKRKKPPRHQGHEEGLRVQERGLVMVVGAWLSRLRVVVAWPAVNRRDLIKEAVAGAETLVLGKSIP